MDRQTVYFGQLARETDLLLAEQNAMVALAKFSGAVLGLTTIVNGFTCTPTGPATLNVLLTPGEIYQLENIEQSTWSSLPTNTNTILKQGVIQSNTSIAITPPGTVGFSQVYLIEVEYQDLDTGSTVLPYYNAANPALPFSGPANAGTAQNTVRQGIVAIQAKAGIAATTGTQVTPTADAGWTGLFTVTVANGQSTITSGNISQVASAPFIPATLPAIPADVQANKWTYATDTGTTNAVVIALSPAPTSYQAGDIFFAKIANTNNGASTLNVNGLGAVSVVHANDSSALNALDLNAGAISAFAYDGTHFQLAWSQRQPGVPVYLQAPATYYVNAATGSDSNDGLSATVTGGHGPFATIQHACNVVNLFNLNGFSITVNVADGTNAPFVTSPIGGSGSVNIIGNLTTPANCIVNQPGSAVSSAITLAGTGYTVAGFKVTASSGSGLTVTVGSSNYYNMEFGACGGCHIQLEGGSILTALGAGLSSPFKRVTGSATHHILLTASSKHNVDVGPFQALTLTGTPAFTDWSNAQAISLDREIYSSITGSATGQRYNGQQNSIIDTNGGGATYLPGNAAGSLASGAQYT